MRNNKVAIIGAGISGLSAGIHALQAGYDVTIYEKNRMPGGECTGWNRQGYHIRKNRIIQIDIPNEEVSLPIIYYGILPGLDIIIRFYLFVNNVL